MTKDSTQKHSTSGIGQLRDIFTILHAEVLEVGGATADDTKHSRFSEDTLQRQVSRRVLTRSIVALFEGVAHGLRVMALSLDDKRTSLTEIERWAAAERTYELAESGALDERRAKLRTVPLVRLSFSLAAKAVGADFQLSVNAAGWQAFRETIRIRDRLTHPRSPVELEVTDGELHSVLSAFSWFQLQFQGVMAAVVEAQIKQIQDKDVVCEQFREGATAVLPKLRKWIGAAKETPMKVPRPKK